MKKIWSVLLLSGMLISLAACGGAAPETKAPAASAASATAAPATQPVTKTQLKSGGAPEGSAEEELVYEGVVKEMKNGRIFVAADDGTGQEFNIESAEREEEDGLMPGCYVSVSYIGGVAADVLSAESVYVQMDIEQQADAEGRDPVLYGTVSVVDANDLVVIDLNGVERTFDNCIARQVTFGNIASGTEVMVTYIGSLDPENQIAGEYGSGSGDPLALKVVSMDAAGSEEAEKDYIKGEVERRMEDAIVVVNAAGEFTFLGTPELFGDIKEEDYVRAYYKGALYSREVDAEMVETIG